MTKYLSVIAVLLGVFSYNSVAYADNQSATESDKFSNYNSALEREYSQISDLEAQRFDWPASYHFKDKAERVARGALAVPELLKKWDIDNPDLRSALKSARACLVMLVPDENPPDCDMRQTAPRAAAHALGRFDCWIEGAADWDPSATGEPCRLEFVGAIAFMVRKLLAAPKSCRHNSESVKGVCMECESVLNPTGEECPSSQASR